MPEQERNSRKLLVELQGCPMKLDIKPEIAAALQSLASAKGLSAGDYLKQLVEKELPLKPEGPDTSKGSGMALENGIWVYDNGDQNKGISSPPGAPTQLLMPCVR